MLYYKPPTTQPVPDSSGTPTVTGAPAPLPASGQPKNPVSQLAPVPQPVPYKPGPDSHVGIPRGEITQPFRPPPNQFSPVRPSPGDALGRPRPYPVGGGRPQPGTAIGNPAYATRPPQFRPWRNPALSRPRYRGGWGSPWGDRPTHAGGNVGVQPPMLQPAPLTGPRTGAWTAAQQQQQDQLRRLRNQMTTGVVSPKQHQDLRASYANWLAGQGQGQ